MFPALLPRIARPHLPGGGGLPTLAFTAALALGLLCHWLSPFLPMLDIAQHAGQIALLRDHLAGKPSAWEQFLWINWATPYLLAYLAAALLAQLMPVATAISLLLSAALLGFSLAFSQLRRQLQADTRLDILAIPAFFGFAWHWGLFNFLLAMPIALLWVSLAICYAACPTRWRGTGLLGLGCILFFCHVVALAYALLLGGLYLLYSQRCLRGLLQHCWPHAILAVAAMLWVQQTTSHSPLFGATSFAMTLQGDYGQRLLEPLTRVISIGPDMMATLLTAFSFMALFLLLGSGSALRLFSLLPLLAALLIWLLMPSLYYDTAYLYERFSLILLPSLALAVPALTIPSLAQRGLLAGLNLAALALMLLLTSHVLAYRQESADFSAVLAQTTPGNRALSLIAAPESSAMRNPALYTYAPLWYQTLQQGWVDFNFAYHYPPLFRFKPGHYPAANNEMSWFPEQNFNWQQHQGAAYDYYFVRTRNAAQQQAMLTRLQAGGCIIRPVAIAGSWQLYARGVCPP